jgi:hypothetical protein
MIRTLFLAAFAAAATPALAQTDTGSDVTMFHAGGSNAADLRASQLVGRRLFATESQVRSDFYLEIPADWVEVGVVEDVVLNATNANAALLVAAGSGRVAVNLGAVRFPMDGTTPEDMTDYILVINANAAALTEMPVYGENEVQPAAAPAETDVPAVVEDDFLPVPSDALTPDVLSGIEVFDRDDQSIGRIDSVIVDDAGVITQAIVDVGGFLGINPRPVALPVEELTVLRRQSSGQMRVQLPQSGQELGQLPRVDQVD